jgi:integrase
MSYENYRYFVPSSLPALQTAKKRQKQARKSAMKPSPLTYKDILEKLNYFVTTKQLNPNTAANRASALRGFLRANHLSEDDVVGEEMRSKFVDCVERFLDSMRELGRTQRNITNTRAALTPIRQIIQEDDIARALDAEKPTPFMLQLKTLLHGHSVRHVAKISHVPYDMMLGWLNGKVPRPSSARYVHRVETYFGMERGELWKLSGAAHPSRLQPDLGGARVIQYRESLGALTKMAYRFVAPPDSPLRKQWHDFMVYKTALVPELERGSKAKWRISPLPMGRKSESSWWKYLGDVEVASAHAGWAKVAAYLGWLNLPQSEGGAGIPAEELHTLAWLAVPDYLTQYIDWRKRRAGGKHTTFVPEFLGWVMSLVRPVEGYFPQSPWLYETLPERYRKGSWAELCERQMKFCRRMTQSLKGQIEINRDPFEPLNGVLELDEPLEAIVDMIQRMRANRPISNPVKEAVWSRDIVLIKLLVSNPLRQRNLAHMTWRPDNTGNLYQKNDGSWHIRWKSIFFKNARGAAGDLDYDAEVHPSVWADLERYLFKHRPLLMRHPTDLLFLTKAKDKHHAAMPHSPWTDLSKRVFEITKKYLWNCPGIGTHSFRHLIGSSIIKAAPGEIHTVARVLNDRPTTVEKHYARFTSSDGNKRMGELLAKSLKRL